MFFLYPTHSLVEEGVGAPERHGVPIFSTCPHVTILPAFHSFSSASESEPRLTLLTSTAAPQLLSCSLCPSQNHPVSHTTPANQELLNLKSDAQQEQQHVQAPASTAQHLRSDGQTLPQQAPKPKRCQIQSPSPQRF